MGSARGRPRRRKNPLGGLPSFGKAGARSAKHYSYPFRSPDSKSLFKYKSCPQDGSPLTQDNASPTRLVQVSHEDAFSLRHPQEQSSATFDDPLRLLQLRPTAWWIRSPVSFQSSRLSAPEMPHMPKIAKVCWQLPADIFPQAEHTPKGAKKDRKSAFQGSNQQHACP